MYKTVLIVVAIQVMLEEREGGHPGYAGRTRLPLVIPLVIPLVNAGSGRNFEQVQ